MYNKFSKSQRGAPSNSKVQKAAPKKAAPAPVKKASKSAGKPVGRSGGVAKFPSSMSVPGQLRHIIDGERSTGITRTPKTGRDRFGPSRSGSPAARKNGLVPGRNRQEDEAKVMSAMRRDRLGPGQR